MARPDEATVLAAIQETMRDLFDDAGLAISPQTSRENEERWDSMNHLNLVFALEQRFGIRFGVADAESIRTVADLIALVREKVPV
jgi:acyl carrier protein